jgi:phospholipase/lecithinase/hemolysin
VTGAPGSEAEATITGTEANPILNLTIPQGSNGAAGAAGTPAFTPSVGLVLWCGDSYSDQSNFWALEGIGGGPDTNGNTFATEVLNYLGQNSNGRYTTAGSPPNALGQNYAVAGAGIGAEQIANTTLPNQISKLLADYPDGLPENNLVVLSIGGNDIGPTIENNGGVFATNGLATQTWTTNANFTIPAINETVEVSVVSSQFCAAGTTSPPGTFYVSLPAGYIFNVTAVPDGTHITIANSLGFAEGTVIDSPVTFSQESVSLINGYVSAMATPIANLIAAGANIVWTLLQDVSTQPDLSAETYPSAHATWEYWTSAFAAGLYPTTAKNVSIFDLASVFAAVTANPTSFGFKDATTSWDNSTSMNANDLVYWDVVHPTAAMHRVIAQAFIAWLKKQGLVTLY